MRFSHPGHVWENLEDEDFLLKLGAAGTGADGKKHPTAAGLLMLGRENDILREFNTYSLDYREQNAIDEVPVFRIFSSSGGWSGNVYDFFFRVCDRLNADIWVPAKEDGTMGEKDPSVFQALREALANCLIHADYHGRQGVVIVRKRNSVTMVNPGGFRIGIDTARSGGVSDPRNAVLSKMFHLIGIGERSGSGIPDILRVWRRHGWRMPSITEQLEPERTRLTLSFEKNDGKKQEMKIGGVKTEMSEEIKEAIIVFLTDHLRAGVSEISEYLDLKPSYIAEYMNELMEEGAVVADTEDKDRVYRLKS